MAISRQQAQNMRDNFLNPIWDRTVKIKSACTIQNGLLKWSSRSIKERPKEPSDPTPYRTVYRVEAGEIGWALSKKWCVKLDPKAIRLAGLGGLLEGWLALQAEGRKLAVQMIRYCHNVEEKLRVEFKCKGIETPYDVNWDEYAFFPALAVFICEKQLELTNEGLNLHAGGTSEIVPLLVEK